MEFRAFPKIEKVGRLSMTITQKIHGSNAQAFVFQTTEGDLDLMTGSRNRWITPDDDNFGFAKYVQENRDAFLKLGPGQHFGEWAGPGINSGEGLTEKTFVLFDFARYVDVELPPRTVLVPVLYDGPLDHAMIDRAMDKLKTEGSILAPGFMRPEGVVVRVAGVRYKKVFDAEETQWKKPSGLKEKLQELSTSVDVEHLLQPIRLQKLLSRDEKLLVMYPASLKLIASTYVADLIEEGQIVGTEDEIKAHKKALGSQLFAFLKDIIGTEMGL
jgi:hypothetical protein